VGQPPAIAVPAGRPAAARSKQLVKSFIAEIVIQSGAEVKRPGSPTRGGRAGGAGRTFGIDLAGDGTVAWQGMNWLNRLKRWFQVPVLTTPRIWFAFAVAVTTDVLQLLLGPLGWAFIDEGLDLLAMGLTCGALGFHVLLLPTFIIELVPVADWLPTWTGCTAMVVTLRRKAQTPPPRAASDEDPAPAPPRSAPGPQP